jgi:structural hemagglutinin/hemolysin toxin protein RtxA
MRGREKMYILVTYVPPSHLEVVKDALFAAGGGAIGAYDQCCFQTLGTGQFRPLAGSSPFVGTQDTLERCDEWRIELAVEKDRAAAVVAALLASHPYEVPAYHLIPVITDKELTWQKP